MSKSIRSYFTVTKKQTAKIVDDDSDVIPDSPDVQPKNKKKQSRKKRLIEDSDEEIFSSKKKKTDTAAQSTKQKSPKLKEVTITDLFGNGKIKKTDALVTKDKATKQTETGIHSDDEFEQSLLELDEVDDKSLKQDNSIEILQTECSNKTKINDEIKNVPNIKGCENHEKNKYEETKSDSFESKSSEKNKNQKTSERKLDTSKSKSREINKNINHEVIEIDDDSKSSNKSDDITKKSHVNYADSQHNESKIDKKFNSSRENKVKNHIESTKNKRDLTEFLDEDDNNEKSNKKKKHNVSLNDSVISDEDRHERKRLSAALYQKYLNRTGPKHLGAKEIPEGTPDCLKGCAFLLTGVLDSFEREEVVAAITKYGGTIKSGISKKVTHVLAGDDAGPAKTTKAEELGIPIINEDQFLNMITKLSNKDSKVYDKSKENSEKITKPKIKIEKESHNETKTSPKVEKSKSKDKLKDKKEKSDSPKDSARVKKHRSVSPKANVKKERLVSPKRALSDKVKKEESESINKDDSMMNGDIQSPKMASTSPLSLMWVDKYKPQNIKQIIGQHGEASNVKKLMNWVTKWYVNRKAKLAKPNPWAKNDDGAFYKAALLSGPPGVGKTTTVSLVCKELGFDTVEFNASDTRSKNLIKEQISELLSTTTLSGYARGETGKQAVTKKHVLVMDEVDGMAGNEDRGGLQELISLIKSTSVPIICMCNDRNSEKMRSLVNYCYDLRFSRPRVDQIKAAMMTICFKEGFKIPGDVLSQLISAAGQDVRQTLHLLSVWTADPGLADRDRLQGEARRVKKDIKMGPWEAIRKVFSAEEHKHMSIIDRSDLFFADYSLAPLFVHENYPQVVPHCPKHEVLDRMSKAVDSISLGDLVDSRIRSQQAWSLLPLQAMYSSVIPGQELSGHMAGQIQFPGWLGKNSRANKMARLAQSIHAHTRLSTSGSKSSIFLDYAPHIRDAILNPLIKDKNEGISQSLQVLESYHLLREDLESLVELSLWPGQRNPNVLIDAKVKAAMTRTYNKQASALPYAPGAIKRAKHHDTEEQDLELGAEDDDVENDSDPENDALIKKKKTKDVEKPSSSKEKSCKGGKGKKK